MVKNCVACGKEFNALSKAKTCSARCSKEHQKEYNRKCRKTPKNKEYLRKYQKTPKRMEYNRVHDRKQYRNKTEEQNFINTLKLKEALQCLV